MQICVKSLTGKTAIVTIDIDESWKIVLEKVNEYFKKNTNVNTNVNTDVNTDVKTYTKLIYCGKLLNLTDIITLETQNNMRMATCLHCI